MAKIKSKALSQPLATIVIVWHNSLTFGGRMAKMKDIKNEAKKRRASLLKAFTKFNGTVTDFAERYEMTRARMSQILVKAKDENV
jgi:hypothetical protein